MAAPQKTARSCAVYMMTQILSEGRLMAELSQSGAMEGLSPADRARAQRLTMDTLRALERADRILSKFMRKAPPLYVQNVMRLATMELCTGGDAHGIVNDAVNLVAGNKRAQAFKGMVNAVLRKVADKGPQEWTILRMPRLPKWLRAPLVSAYGPEKVAQFEAVHFQSPPLDITVKNNAHLDALAETLDGEIILGGSVRLKNPGQVSTLPGFDAGDWWVQDAAAALPVRLLGDIAGKTVLDICAAPGGKTMQLAAAGAQVTALDVSEHRLKRVLENLERTDLKATVIAQNALEHNGSYDIILLDAPCSATGTIRRHPDLPYSKDGAKFTQLFQLQSDLIDHAVSLLNPEGLLVYCTCSLFPDEGECQIEDALVRHKNMAPHPVNYDGLDIPKECLTQEGGLRITPDLLFDKGGLDGFYIAVLRKNS